MYICICNAVRETEFRNCARRVSGCAETVLNALGKQPQCGQCLCEAEEILNEERECVAA
ncbi:ferredoxin [Tsuneonella sp. CC-YZS046]|uniref:(2Fe-2S)-binding protein n=1 Tax=Tsuneonella sp. CC-YZS046 TaxID=3042152 RepID=UPI002D77CB2D|nr:ferredoxin [Tsuneonella sp. CC-YZS046]WRO65385.1 ferredoxin [Tsuneonella sp. CC-YZS046]